MRLQYTYEESDCYAYDPEPTYVGGAPPIRTEGIPVGWKKGSFAMQDGLSRRHQQLEQWLLGNSFDYTEARDWLSPLLEASSSPRTQAAFHGQEW